MASSPAFVGNPRVVVSSLTTGDSDTSYSAGENGGIVRRIWVNATSDEDTILVTCTLDGFMVGAVNITPTGLTNSDDGLWGTATELLLSGLFPGLSLDPDRYFNLGPDEELLISAAKPDGAALGAGERVDVRIEGADY